MTLRSIALISFFLALPLAAQATAYKCTDSAGKISFSDIPCPTTVTREEKVMGRGAGSNPLSAEEKQQFLKGVMQSCSAPRNVCECFGDTLANTLTYEEIQQSMRNKNKPIGSIIEKSKKALQSCETMVNKR